MREKTLRTYKSKIKIISAFFLFVMLTANIITPAAAYADDPPGRLPNDHCEREPDHSDYDPEGKNDCPSSPSPEEIAAEAAKAAKRFAEGLGISVDDIPQSIMNFITAMVTETLNEAYAMGADGCGDPVLLTTGTYVLEALEYNVVGSSLNIGRKYQTEEKITGSIGTGWLLSVDSRIMRGITVADDAKLAEMENVVKRILKECYEPIEKQYYEAGLIAEEIYNEIYLPLLRQLEGLKMERARGEELATLNRYSRFAGTPVHYENIGNGKLVLVDELGSPKVFEPAGAGVWVPIAYPERLYERLESRDGRGAESTAGFVFYGRGGVTKEYDKNGLLIKVTELNGNSVEIIRDNEGKITRISGPHGAEYSITHTGNLITNIIGPEGKVTRYGYSGNLLSWVQDADGDTVRYAYENGRLKEIIKPDGSAVRLTYGLTNGGVQLVTATAHEEGASERFDYNPGQRTTVYTNHSGVRTQYRYDEKHRTVEETGNNGSVKTYGYNSLNQLGWERVNGFEIRYSYDGRGNISERTYGDGTRERWEWNGNDQRTKYIDRDGVVTEWMYDYCGNCLGIFKGGVRIFTGMYDGRNRLVASREGDRAETRYEYDSRDYLRSRAVTIDRQEIRELWEYDGLGRVTKYTDGIGKEWKYTYLTGETIEETPTGLQRRYITNNRKDLVQIIEKDLKTGEIRELNVRYDRRHLPLEITDGSGNIRNEYREDGRLIRWEQGPWYWEYVYEAGGRIREVTRGKEGTEERYTERYGYAWQANGAQTRTVTIPGIGNNSFGVNAFGQITNITNVLGENSTRTVSGTGNVIREQGASGGFYEYRYDALGRMAEAGRENERGIQARYNSDGTIAEKTDRLGNVTRYVYDGRGLLSREITALGEERHYYDAAGRAIRRETLSRNTSTVYYTEWGYNDNERTLTVTAGGTYTETLYLNAWGEVVRRIDGEGNERRYEYDKAGRLVKTIDGYGNTTGYEWNEIGKIKRITYTDNEMEEYEYDHLGNLTEIRDALGTAWAGVYDEAGRLKKETGRPGINREYGYDALNRITEVKIGSETAERYRYTERGREVIFTDGEGSNFSQNKNVYGELTAETNRLHDSQGYAYDAEGRLIVGTSYSGKQTRIEYRDSEGITITTYSDGTQSIIERDKAGNIIRITGGTGTIRYRYDAGGMLIEQNDEGAGEVTRYAYNRAGQKAKMQSGSRDVQYYYGKNGELTYIRDTGQRLEARYEYDSRGRETRRVYGNGVKLETLYDRIGRVILIKETDSQNRLLRVEGYLYDEQGRRSHSVDGEGRITKYIYNGKSQLSAVLYPWTAGKVNADKKEAEEAGLYFTPEKGLGQRYTYSAAELALLRELLNRAFPVRGNAVSQSQMVWLETYAYDRNGNRATKTTPWGTVRYDYDAENRLIGKGDIVYTNDKDGNTLSERGLRYEAGYEYNGQNRMAYSEVTSHVDRTHMVTWYAYDALGRRTLTENAAGQAVRTLYDGKSFEAIREGETFQNGSLTTRYAAGGVTANGVMQSNQATGERYRWISEDGSGRITSEDGYSVEGSRYGGRGVTLYGKGEAVAVSYSSSTGSRSTYLGKDLLGSVKTTTTDTGAVEDRYEYDAFGTLYQGDLSGGMNLGYTGKPYDTATGLYNYGFRDYKPQIARFTTVDPVRDGNNWYAYVNNDPVNYIDLLGLACDTIDLQNIVDGIIGNTPRIPLSTLVNTENLSNIIVSNSSSLSAETGDHVRDIGARGVKDELDIIEVAFNIDKGRQEVQDLFALFDLPHDTMAVSVGNTVVVFGDMQRDANDRIIVLGDANLLAHEAIHTLRANALGGFNEFLVDYMKPDNAGNAVPYESKPAEIEAYTFGPSNYNVILPVGLSRPILEQPDPFIRRWFR